MFNIDNIHYPEEEFKPPTFKIFLEDGTKVPTLQKAFLVKQILTNKDYKAKIIIGDDGTVWNLVFEPSIIRALKYFSDATAYCLISYQTHTYGKFAVCRMSKDKQQAFSLDEIRELEY